MASSRATNTFEEALQGLLGDIARMKAMPDADLDFCVQLETAVLGKIREPTDMLAQAQAQKAGLPMPGGGASAGPPAGPGLEGIPPEMAAAMAGPGGGMGELPMPPVNGTRIQPNMPNPDEFRRMVQPQ